MTYSLIARDPDTHEFGVAVQTHHLAVGTMVPWARSAVGAIASQSRGPGIRGQGRGGVEGRYGALGLELLQTGVGARSALDALLVLDPFADWRQVAIVDADGDVAVHTGSRCVPEAGHHVGRSFSAQGNMMSSAVVWEAIGVTFERGKGPLAECMLDALQAGQSAGGDLRGQQSAALLIVAGKASGQPWRDRHIDLRVDDHKSPVAELQRLLRLKRGYLALEESHDALWNGDTGRSALLRDEVLRVAPEMIELRFWCALDAAVAGSVSEGVSRLREIIAEDAIWLEYLRRLRQSNWLPAELVAELESQLTEERL